MLQQTQVATVLPYYERFLAQLPTVQALAQAPQEKLNKLWEGLGYYSRVHNLKKAAQTIMEQYGGVIPDNYRDLLTLPGIGPYTAGAIASIAFGERVPAVDGNILRILSRLDANDAPINTTATRKALSLRASELIPTHRPGDFNQALMDLGATICLAKGVPLCEECPISRYCAAHAQKLETILPVREKRPQRKTDERTILIFLADGHVYLEKRPSGGLLANLWEFKNLEKSLTGQMLSAYLKEKNVVPLEIIDWGVHYHLFTHIRWNMHGYLVTLENMTTLGDGQWLERKDITETITMPTALRPYRDKLLANPDF